MDPSRREVPAHARCRRPWGLRGPGADRGRTANRARAAAAQSLSRSAPPLHLRDTPGARRRHRRHWDQAGRRPPIDIASELHAAPRRDRFGGYQASSSSTRAGSPTSASAPSISAGGGPATSPIGAIPKLMDVMSAHDIHVTFHLEPYRDDHAGNYARDIQYLLKEYGDRRRLGLLAPAPERATAKIGPVFKSFRTIVPETATDCQGVRYTVADYTADSAWRRQTDRVRETFRERLRSRSRCSPIRWTSIARARAASTASRSTTTSSPRFLAGARDRLLVARSRVLVQHQPRLRRHPRAQRRAGPVLLAADAVRARRRGLRLVQGGRSRTGGARQRGAHPRGVRDDDHRADRRRVSPT